MILRSNNEMLLIVKEILFESMKKWSLHRNIYKIIRLLTFILNIDISKLNFVEKFNLKLIFLNPGGI